MYASLIPLRKLPASLVSTFTYNVPKELEGRLCLGQLVEAPFRATQLPMVVWELSHALPDTPRQELKSVSRVLTLHPILTVAQHTLVQWMRETYAVHEATLLKRILPELTKHTVGDYAQARTLTRTYPTASPFVKSVFVQAPSAPFLSPRLDAMLQETARGDHSALLLVPNLFALAALEDELRHRGYHYLVVHGDLSPTAYRALYAAVTLQESRIVIGTRKALFLPYGNLRAVIQFCANDPSYKQWDMKPRYRTRDVAQKLCALHGSMFVRQDVYPGVEDIPLMKNGQQDIIAQTYQWKPLRVVSQAAGKRDTIPEAILHAIDQTLREGRQAMLISYGTDHGSVLVCKDCGWKPLCPACDAVLFVAKGSTLACRWCTHQRAVPVVCATCKSAHLVERMPKATNFLRDLRRRFPLARIAAGETDQVMTYATSTKLFKDWKRGLLDILVGGPHLAYGWLLPQTAFCSILSFESLLGQPGYQSREHAFFFVERLRSIGKELSLVARNPEHELFQYLGEGGHKIFFTKELNERKELGYPPYTKLLSCTTRAIRESVVTERLAALAHALDASLKDRSAHRYVTHAPYVKKRSMYFGTLTIKYAETFVLPRMLYGEEWVVDPYPENIL